MPAPPTPPRFLRYAAVAPGQPFHASAYRVPRGQGEFHPEHGQDFYEFMLVVHSGGRHLINGASQPLSSGQLILVRPADVHGLSAGRDEEMYFFNIAFPAQTWHLWGQVLGEDEQFEAWAAAPAPPMVLLAPDELQQARSLAQSMVEAYLDAPQALQLCRFWCALLPFLHPGQRELALRAAPPDWLREAVGAMHHEENLRLGLPRFLGLCHVSQPHLCRAVRASYGCSPTALINDLRLRRSARLLIRTNDDPLVLAARCGYENASYFYRSFKKRYGTTPRVYRLRARSQVFLGGEH